MASAGRGRAFERISGVIHDALHTDIEEGFDVGKPLLGVMDRAAKGALTPEDIKTFQGYAHQAYKGDPTIVAELDEEIAQFAEATQGQAQPTEAVAMPRRTPDPLGLSAAQRSHPLEGAMDSPTAMGGVSTSPLTQLALRTQQQEAIGQLPVEQPKGPVIQRDAATRQKIKQETTPVYQMEGRGRLAGYASNPLEEEGRQQIARQFMSAPLGGHVRRAAEGQEIFGHKITRGEARVAEQTLAGLTATGVGGAAFLAAIDGLNGQTSGTMPMY